MSDHIREASQLGGAGNIVGVTFNDVDGDGVFDSEDQTIPGVTVFVDQNNDGLQNPNELFSVSRPDGAYSFLGLLDGEYPLRQIPPAGTVSTAPEPIVVPVVNADMVRDIRINFGSTVGGPVPPPPPGLGSIFGVKYNDFNRNGFRDPAEPPLPGFTIYLDQNNNNQLDPGEPSSISGSDGSFSFSNLPLNATYTIREIQQPGFVQTIPDPVLVSLSPEQPTVSDFPFGNATTGPGIGNISGVLFEDLDIDGFRDSNEPGISGSEVFLDGNRNGILDEGEVISVTDEFGSYSFIEVTPGLFNVDVIRELDVARTTPNPVIIFTGTEEDIPNVVEDIGLIVPGGTGNVEGVKYLDINANGIFDFDEPGLPNFTIYADLNSNEILDVGEPFDITSQNGSYFLANLPATRITIGEAEEQLGFNLTSQFQTVDVPDGGTLSGVNFGNAEINAISGLVFLDNNSNGAIDPGDIGLSNSTVYLDLNQNGIFDPEEPFRITSDRGFYSFNTLPPDEYVVRVVPQPGFIQTTADPVIVVTSGEDANFVNIGQAPDSPLLRGDLIGNKFNDFNSNGILDPGEPGLANFTLYLDLDGDNILDPEEPASISNVNGDFSFNNPPIGTYFLREIPQAGFVKTTPDQEITITQPINVLQGDPPIVLNVGNAVIAPPAPEGPDGPEAETPTVP
ncbi:SdrD B-like domain-containing protein, partial [Dapis sp. BLCC M126]|uniref:SdrD B-like domain-containing protein n=1 Tax=Dapis sp. BLCC M126 TaxID=3400189 RepID=UPI003CF65EAA